MKAFLKKQNDKYLFYIEKKQIFVEKDKPLFVYKKKHANSIINKVVLAREKDQYSLVNLTYFSCGLEVNDKKKIVNILLDFLENDLILYRYFEDEKLRMLINEKLNLYVEEFSENFRMKLFLVNSLSLSSKKINSTCFKEYLINLNVFLLSCIYKLTCLTKSVILSYFFITRRLNYNKLFELTNIENNFQQKHWGYVDEQKKIDVQTIKILKNISLFFKNIN